MSWQAWLTLAVVALCIGLLARSRNAPDIVLAAGLTVLLGTWPWTPADVRRSGPGHRGSGS